MKYLSVEQMAQRWGLAPRTVRNAVMALVRHRLLQAAKDEGRDDRIDQRRDHHPAEPELLAQQSTHATEQNGRAEHGTHAGNRNGYHENDAEQQG